MPTINDRIGSQNVIRVLANASAPPTRLNNLTDVDSAREATNGLILIWDPNGGTAGDGGYLLGNDIAAGLNISGITTINKFESNAAIFTGVTTSATVSASTAIAMGATTVITAARQLQNIASLDTTTTATIEAAVSAAPNTFTNLNITGVSTFVGLATFGSGLKVSSGVSTFIGNITGTGGLNITGFIPGGNNTLNVVGHSELDGVNITGVTTFSNADVIFQGAAGGQNITFDASENDLEFTDAARIKFGNSDDLEIWHDAPNSHIKNSTGDFKIRSDSLALKTADDGEKYLKAVKNADVKLYYNDNEKFATISTGATVTGDLYIGGDLYLGDDLVLDNITGNSLKITGLSTFVGDAQFDGNVSIGGTLTYEDVTNVDSIGIVTARQGFRATAGGIDITAGISTFRQGINVAGLSYLDGDVSFVGAAYNLLWDKDTSKLKFYDLTQLTFGDGNDLQIYSDGTNGIIKGNDSTNILGITSVTSVDYYGTDATLTGTLTAGLIDGGTY